MTKCYVIMRFRKEFDELYYNAITPAIEECFGKGSCTRPDQEKYAGIITDKIFRGILNADIVIADITGTSPNVMYELGVAHSFKKPTILMISEKSEELDDRIKIPFDISTYEAIIYKYDHEDTSEERRVQLDQIKEKIKEYLTQMQQAKITRISNPLADLLVDHYVFVDDLRYWLLGYMDVYEIEKDSGMVWEITSTPHWLARDPLFNQLVIDGIVQERRKYYYIIPDMAPVIEEVKNFIEQIKAATGPGNNKVARRLRYIVVEREFFEFMPLEIVLYDPQNPVKSTGIICEPMAMEVGLNTEFDEMVRSIPEEEWKNLDKIDKWKEKWFDIKLHKQKVQALTWIFKQRWNIEIEKCISEAENDEDRNFLRENWLIQS